MVVDTLGISLINSKNNDFSRYHRSAKSKSVKTILLYRCETSEDDKEDAAVQDPDIHHHLSEAHLLHMFGE